MLDFITGATALIALLTVIVAWLTWRVSKATKKVAEDSHDLAKQALDVAIKDWKQVGREEPWSLTKLDKNYWLLERVHYDPVAIIMAEVTPHCGGSMVNFVNTSGVPVGIFRRGSKIVLEIPATNAGSELSLYYREYAEGESVPPRNRDYFAGSSLSEGAQQRTAGTTSWNTPLY